MGGVVVGDRAGRVVDHLRRRPAEGGARVGGEVGERGVETGGVGLAQGRDPKVLTCRQVAKRGRHVLSEGAPGRTSRLARWLIEAAGVVSRTTPCAVVMLDPVETRIRRAAEGSLDVEEGGGVDFSDTVGEADGQGGLEPRQQRFSPMLGRSGTRWGELDQRVGLDPWWRLRRA